MTTPPPGAADTPPARRRLVGLLKLMATHGSLRRGRGLFSGVLALGLAVASLLGVLAFHFPEYLTTPELRRRYDVELLRELIRAGLWTAGGLSVVSLLRTRMPSLPATAFALVAISVALGGHRVEVGDFPEGTPYIGLDWFVLDLLGSALLFVFLEKLLPLRPEQPVFRPQWQLDLQYFALTHLGVGALMLAVHGLAQPVAAAASAWLGPWGAAVAGLPMWAALPLAMLAADLVQYAVHRACHEVPWLWRFHAVHHSVEHMDWLAGSRLHLLEVVFTRGVVLGALLGLGFSRGVIDLYIVVAGLQAVFIHANVDVRLGPLRHVIVTPNFHHWHHGQDREAIDRHYAVHFAFIDRLLGTAVASDSAWPKRYGLRDESLPDGLWRQLLAPFRPARRT